MRPSRGSMGAAIAGAAALLFACSKVPTGELGQGEFRYLCAPGQVDTACGDSTLQCDGDPTNGATCHLPDLYAVGARFQIGYAPTTDFGYGTLEGQTNYLIVPASPELASGNGNTIVPLRAGWEALLAMQTGLTSVDDFVHVEFAAIAKLAPSQGSIAVATGESQTVSLTPTAADNSPLAGELACDWTIESSSCIAWLPGGTHQFGGVTVEGVAPGSGTLHVVCGASTADIPLTVTGAGSTGSCDGGTEGGDGAAEGGDAAAEGGDDGGTDGSGDGGGNG
jgi:hypothetical protein